MSTRNEHGAPPHHANCVVIHSTRRYPCFPASKDAFTLSQKKWLLENKENVPSKDVQKNLLKTRSAFNKKYDPYEEEDARKEDIELDEPEEE